MAESNHAAKTKAVIEDVFRRADKHDHGALSLKDFQEFFSDGIMTNEELEELFHVIDTAKSNSLSPSELCEYFKQFYGDFEQIFSLVDDLGLAISDAMKATHKKHQSGDETKELTHVEKFVTRFLLKEALEHVNALCSPLENAIEHHKDVALNERVDKIPAMVDTTVAAGAGNVPKWRKKYQSLISCGSSGSVDFGGQIERLADLVDKLEGKVQLNPVQEEEVVPGKQSVLTMVRVVLEADVKEVGPFRQSLRKYIQATGAEAGCIHVCVQSCAETMRFSLYEVWLSQRHLNDHYAGSASRTFRKDNVDHLIKPAVTSTIEIPASWWPDADELP